MRKIKNPADLESFRQSCIKDMSREETWVAVCCGTGCSASGAHQVVSSFKEALQEKNIDGKITTRVTGCHGFCEQGPLVVVHPGNYLYCQVTPDDVEEIIEKTIIQKKAVERLQYTDPVSKEKVVVEDQVPFYYNQHRLLMGNNGIINPTSINDYLAINGYRALSMVLQEKSPLEVIEEIKASGLRGRGGAGFPTGLKWESCYNAPDNTRYVICNADEGDPGCFQDRSILEGNPHSVLEGMIIGAYAVSAEKGYIYVRNEYPLAVKNFSTALEQAREYGLLGENILGSGFSFDVKINRGGGAFVCGESSALIASIEGKAGEPRDKYIHATEKGLWDKPTVLNNVKTWASVPYIINNGADWYAQIGTEKSKGTMVFSLTGNVNNTGLVEVPMGITLRKLVFDIGGGIPEGKNIKAVQTGGPSGGCIPEKLLDLPLDYEKLTEAGSMMGSGGMIVMDESTCMVDVARYFLSFTQEESCGKCTPCREGGKQMLAILNNIMEGKGQENDLDMLEEIAQAMKEGSLCALGGMAPNPVLTTLKYFHQEYLDHIRDKKCPAKVCRNLIKYFINQEVCTGCGRCLKACPVDAVEGTKDEPHIIHQEKCTKCGACLEVCRYEAISVE